MRNSDQADANIKNKSFLLLLLLFSACIATAWTMSL